MSSIFISDIEKTPKQQLQHQEYGYERNQKEKIRCPQCDYQATRKDRVDSHRKSVHMGMKVQCPDCDYEANQKDQMVSHHRSVHLGQSFSVHNVIMRQMIKDV